MRYLFQFRLYFLSALSLMLTFSVSPPLSAQTESQTYSSANRDFENGNFQEAETKYRSLIQKDLASADLYFNLGSTLYRLDRPGEAALWYRRAIVLDPGLSEAAQSLAFLQKKTGYLEFAESDFAKFIRALSPQVWTWIFSLCFWLFGIFLATAILIPRARRFRPLLITFAVFGLLLGIFAYQAGRFRDRHLAIDNFATVTDNSISARTAPVPDSAEVIALPPGSEVRITQNDGPWLYVDVPGELRGWVRAEEVAPVWPVEAK